MVFTMTMTFSYEILCKDSDDKGLELWCRNGGFRTRADRDEELFVEMGRMDITRKLADGWEFEILTTGYVRGPVCDEAVEFHTTTLGPRSLR